MRKILYFIILISYQHAFAQMTPFDFLEASRKANEVDQTLRQFNSRYGVSPKSSCETIKGANNEAVATCSIKDEDFNAPIMKVDYPADQIPVQITQALPEQFIKDTKNKKVSCVYSFKMQNDNLQMIGIQAKRRTEANTKLGDDMGKTHSTDIAVNCASSDGISNAFTYSTDLYTEAPLNSTQKLADGNYTKKIKFTSENIFAVLQDNINQGNVTYWKRGVGFINLTDKRKWGILQSTGQQEWFHHVVNKISPGATDQYTYEEGSKDQWGAFVTLAIGLQTNRKFGDRCQLKLNADVGGRLSTLKDTSTLAAKIQAKLSYQVTDNASIYLRAQSEITARSSSTIMENTAAVGVESKAGSHVEIGVTQQQGRRRDVADIPNSVTKKNDLQVFLRVGYKF